MELNLVRRVHVHRIRLHLVHLGFKCAPGNFQGRRIYFSAATFLMQFNVVAIFYVLQAQRIHNCL